MTGTLPKGFGSNYDVPKEKPKQLGKKINPIPYLLGIPIALIVCLVVTQFEFHTGVPYQLEQIDVHLSNALLTDNPVEKVNFMKEAYSELAQYHGNSAWLFTTEETNIDVTKRILLANIEEGENQTSTDDKTQYAFLPHNQLNDFLDKSVNDASNRLDLYIRAYGENPSNNPWLWILIFATPLSVLGLAVGFYFVNKNRLDAYDWNRRYG